MKARNAHFIAGLTKAIAMLDGADADACGINATTARLAIDEALANIKTNVVLGLASVKRLEMLTVEIRALRKALRVEAMAPAVAIGRAKLDHYPELARLTMPSRSIPDQQLITAAHALANSVSRYAEAYAGESLPPNAAQLIRESADALQTAIDRRRHLNAERVGSTCTIEAEIQRARSELGVLDAFVKARLSGHALFMVRWRAIRFRG